MEQLSALARRSALARLLAQARLSVLVQLLELARLSAWGYSPAAAPRSRSAARRAGALKEHAA
jgi:hypothetical protein